MANKKRQKKRRGYYCWSCDSCRPNERFSRRGRKRHVCRKCERLGSEELEYRQAARNIWRSLSGDDRIKRTGRKQVERYLDSSHPRIRALAEEIIAKDAIARACIRAEYELEEVLDEFIREPIEYGHLLLDDSMPF